MFGLRSKGTLPERSAALPGRDHPLPGIPDRHAVLDARLHGPWPPGTQVLYVAMGCFWGAERIFWRQPGVVSTAVGYMGGYTPNATYDEVQRADRSHRGGLVAYDPAATSAERLLAAFWENHDPTQGSRQGNDVGTQYRSAIYWTTPEQEGAARRPAMGSRWSWAAAASAASPRRSGRPRTPGSSTTPRATTSSTCTRTRAATATTVRTV